MRDEEQLLHYIRENAKAYAEAKAQAVYLDHYRKSKLAMLINEAEKKGIKTAQERDSYAREHIEYIELLKGLSAAIEKETYLGLMIKGCWAKIDIWRTQQANERKERGL